MSAHTIRLPAELVAWIDSVVVAATTFKQEAPPTVRWFTREFMVELCVKLYLRGLVRRRDYRAAVAMIQSTKAWVTVPVSAGVYRRLDYWARDHAVSLDITVVWVMLRARKRHPKPGSYK